MTTPSDQEMLEVNTFKSLIHRAIQFEYASWCKERDKKRALEFSFDPGDEDKVSSGIVQYDEYAFESYVIREVDQEFHFRNESLAKALCALDEISRRIILKYFFMDMTDREIGEQMELNLHTVTMQRERSLKKLWRLLSEEDD
jgi:DNA-directed RNA polymerase specialized sigma24 family protein